MLRSQSLPELLVLLMIAAGFAGAMAVYYTFFPDNFDFLTPDEVVTGFITSVCTFWFAVKLTGASSSSGPWLRLFDEFRIGTGMNLIVQALLNYFELLTRSMFLIIVGGVFAASLLAVARYFFRPKIADVHTGTLVVGPDEVSTELAPLLANRVVGTVGPENEHRFEEIVTEEHPRQILVTDEGRSMVPSTALLEQRLKGLFVSSTPDLYEHVLERVYCRGRKPVDLVLSPLLSGNAQSMAIQAIYTNLIGLILLFAASPIILIISLMMLASGAGTVLETVECAGFQKIPFRRTRFRTVYPEKKRAARALAWVITRLQLADLPLLFNVVRGEMALFGPRPIRSEYVQRLTEIVPFYCLRFGVKPGIITWGSVARHRPARECDLIELEYDLYYIKHGSPMLDFDVLTRRIFGGRRRDSAAALAPAS